MLANNAPRSDTTFAWIGNRGVRLAVGARCPCGRELHATDVTVDGSESTKLICAACHRDVLVIEAPDNEEEAAS